MIDSALIREIASYWKNAAYPVVFTGAGMSTESGLPDFRSAKGLWKTRPESLATLYAQQHTPDDFYFFYQWRIKTLWGVEPNMGHKLLAGLQQDGRLRAIITQNVDGLHQRAGSRKVIELHGTLSTVSCMSCRAVFDSRVLLPPGTHWEQAYHEGSYHYGEECKCRKCGGWLRPDVILFGEALPDKALAEAFAFSRQADLFVVLGSSLTVSPANLCPQIAKDNRAKLLIVNQEPTPLDRQANWVVQASIGCFLQQLTEAM